MLQKEFFLTEPFNPSPYWDNSFLVDLSGSAKYEQNTIFLPGRYEVLVQAGGCYSNGSSVGRSGKILKTINITQKFIVRAYCGSSGTGGAKGTNPYSGSFKVNPYRGNISNVSHIFGNCGAAYNTNMTVTPIETTYGGPNCLGNGATTGNGAGSCMHIMPVGGNFGTNYFFAFHTTPSIPADSFGGSAGGGSAYGGSASGSASVRWPSSGDTVNGYSGGRTPYGNGGAKVTQSGLGETYGKDGTGIGHGYATPTTVNNVPVTQGSAAWFDGISWQDITTRTSNSGEQGRIYLKYLGTL